MKKLLLVILSIFIVIGLLVGEFFVLKNTYFKEDTTERNIPKAIMLLIEFRNTEGLVNIVNDMKKRDIKGILMVNGDFVEKYQEDIKKILEVGNIEIAASYDPKPFWEMTYLQQYQTITDMLEKIEGALDIDVRIISSRYMASDENTVKIADELGIEYITARGTTELATTIYKPEEYNVKIISVSNIDVPEFKYGSFCDYSFYERNGSPDDMKSEYERAILNDKFIGVSHTYIGGYKARWNNMWHDFWDNYEVDWVDLDTIGTVDKVMPMWQIPVNKNAPYTPEKIRPAIPYEEEENVINPCLVDELSFTEDSSSNDIVQKEEIIMFHNNTGPMCIDATKFFEENDIEYEEHLTMDSDFTSLLNAYQEDYPSSEGVSSSYGYYPMIFVGEKAYSGFNSEIGDEILEILQ